ncbi:MAG: tetratricopeptide repeat protein [Treponema sp.]|nr:tetratricopeptide repeat protein [Treponema sp.]
MAQTNPLDSVFFVSLPEGISLSNHAMNIDPSIQLPVQRKPGDDGSSFNIADLTQEQILSGILTVLAYDKDNEHADYYRRIMKEARPDIKRELAEAAILKAGNEDWDLAEEIWSALHGLDPEDMAITLNMALFFDQRADSYRRNDLHEDADAYDALALSYYTDAMNADPEIPDAFFNAAFYYLKKRNFSEAKSCFESYLALTADLDDKELGENGLYKKERAQEMVDKIKSRNLEDEQFHAAYEYISSGQEEKGLEAIRKFLQSNPAVWNAWFLLGWGLRRLERYEDAMQAFLKARECDGGDESPDTLNELAICQMETGDYDGAMDSLVDALNMDPDNTKIISNMGFLALKTGKRDEAKKYFETVLEIDPDDKLAQSQVASL